MGIFHKYFNTFYKCPNYTSGTNLLIIIWKLETTSHKITNIIILLLLLITNL